MQQPIYFVSYDNVSRPPPSQAVGNLIVSGREVSLVAVAGGAELRLGYTMNLAPGLRLSISSIAAARQQTAIRLGVAVDPLSHVIDTDYVFPHGQKHTMIRSNVRLPLSLASLEAIERIRAFQAPEFTLLLHGTAMVHENATGLDHICCLQVGSDMPIQFYADRDIWVQHVRNVSPVGSVLVEIPLAVTRAEPWNRVWKALDNAASNLAQGGEMGCKNCVIEVRQALDAWRSIESFEAAASQARRKLDKRQRLHDAASALFHYCSLSVHGDEHQTDWTRADAVLALSTLCALLSARDP
jgi:hypothetical protein